MTLSERVRKQIVSELSQEQFFKQDHDEVVDKSINALSNVELLLRIEWALEEERNEQTK